MNRKQYNNVIEYTLKHDQSVQTEDSLATARAIFNNMGIALPNGSMQDVYETISTNEYMGWRSCTMQEAQEAADNGIAAIGISEDRVVVLSATDEEEPVAQTASVMTLDENTSAFAVEGMHYYSYTDNTTRYGCGGTYRYVNTEVPNCLGYALRLNYSVNPYDLDGDDQQQTTEYYYDDFERVIRDNGYDCRRIASYTDSISPTEYRIAIRCPNDDARGYYYHVIYQLTDGTWAGKDHTGPSQLFPNTNPSTTPAMWANDAYDPDSGTMYCAIRRRW